MTCLHKGSNLIEGLLKSVSSLLKMKNHMASYVPKNVIGDGNQLQLNEKVPRNLKNLKIFRV